MISNRLSLNVAKTQSTLVFTKAKRKALDTSNQNLQVKINGTELEVVSKIKYLGALFDNSLDWKEKARGGSLKVSRGLGILKHSKKSYHSQPCQVSKLALQSPISDTIIVQCGAVLVQLRSIVCKYCITGLLEL